MDDEEVEEHRRIAAILANHARHIEIDPEGLLAADDDDSLDEDSDPAIGGLMKDFAERGLKPTAPIEATQTIKASASDVWAVISAPGNLTNIHPFCSSNPVEKWPGIGGLDHVHYYSGVHYQRDVLTWTEGSGYELLVGPPSGKIATARWWIKPTSSTSCGFGIEVISYVRSDVDPERRATYERKMIREATPPYLRAVVSGVAHFTETGDPVKQNQFGSHDIYSP